MSDRGSERSQTSVDVLEGTAGGCGDSGRSLSDKGPLVRLFLWDVRDVVAPGELERVLSS